ncbi:hypothetical protein WR25_04401 [Diploscapter pachys]|uniref:Uncharacterized protein n=1 Tax=Diploscapter pachys TaxID=2018661 RepID=A0A2A2K042_9BILA|nr:hypothetical protein WR25_04401 [Diploscapter pachys]
MQNEQPTPPAGGRFALVGMGRFNVTRENVSVSEEMQQVYKMTPPVSSAPVPVSIPSPSPPAPSPAPIPEWMDGPRDATALPVICEAVLATNVDEAELAIKELFRIMERIELEQHLEVVEDCFQAISWVIQGKSGTETTGSMVQAIMDPFPFIFAVCYQYPSLQK